MTTPRTEGARLLATYLKREDLKQADVVRALEVSRALVSEWLGGTRRPSESKRAELEAWTGGFVQAAAWETARDRAERSAQEQRLKRLRAENASAHAPRTEG